VSGETRIPAESSVHEAGVGRRSVRDSVSHESSEAEEARLSSERELDDFFENALEGVHWLGADGVVLRANRAALEMLGFTQDEYVGHPVAAFHADPEVARDVLQRLLRHEELRDYPARLRCKNGSIKHVLIHSSPLWRGGRFIHTRCFMRDITERRNAELAVQRLARLHRVTAALSRALSPKDVASAAITEGSQVLGASAAVFSILSSDRAELEVIVASGLAPAAAELEGRVLLSSETARTEAFRTQQPVFLESPEDFRYRYPGTADPDAEIPGSRAVYPLVADGHALGTISFGFPDWRSISGEERMLMHGLCSQCAQALDRARLYEAERNARAEIEAAQRRSAFLLEASTTLASSLEYEDTLARIARLAVPRVADFCIVELAGEQGTSVPVEIAHVDAAKREVACELRRLYPPDASARRGVPNVLRTGRSELYESVPDELLRDGKHDVDQMRLLTELGLPRASLMVVPMVARGRTIGAITLISTDSGRRYGLRDLNMAEDLAHRAAVAVDNARLYLEAREAVRTREDLLGIVSHDLRNPLAGMLMRCALLLETLPQDESGERIRRDIEAMNRSAHRMERLLRDLLDFASIQAGRLGVERKPQPVAELLKEGMESLYALAGKRRIEDHTREIGDNGVQVLCDRERFLQIFSNLIGNALKFTPQDGSVTVRASQRDAEMMFSITDTGPGIPKEESTKIFQKYWQGRGGRTGAGLGLYIAKALVDAHGGRIWVESAPGSGASFFFTLPLAGERAPAPPRSREILVVDDDVAFRRELMEALSAEGYSVVEASDGRQALNYVRTHGAPSLVLLDLMMPIMDGWEFVATTRSDPALASIPVVVMSGLEKAEINTSLLGATGYLRKPPSLDQLLEVVGRTRK
jgi:PAS domain S-box-containing protein